MNSPPVWTSRSNCNGTVWQKSIMRGHVGRSAPSPAGNSGIPGKPRPAIQERRDQPITKGGKSSNAKRYHWSQGRDDPDLRRKGQRHSGDRRGGGPLCGGAEEDRGERRLRRRSAGLRGRQAREGEQAHEGSLRQVRCGAQAGAAGVPSGGLQRSECGRCGQDRRLCRGRARGRGRHQQG